MKRFLIFLTALALSLFFLTPTALAKVISSEKAVTVAEGEVIDDDLFIAGETVTVEGTVNGDLYAVGGTVLVNGVVNGDVLAAGGMINISGKIEDDVRVAAGNVNLEDALVGDSVTIGGGNVNLSEGTKIGGSLIFGSGSLVCGSEISRGVVGGAGMVTLNGSIGKDVYVGAGSLTLGSGARVAGDLVYSSEDKVRLADVATVSGEVRQVFPEAGSLVGEAKTRRAEKIGKGLKTGLRIGSYVAALIVGVLMLYFFQKPSQGVVDRLEKNFWSSLGWGLLVLFLAGPVLILLMITGVGLPLALILGAFLLIELYLTKIFVGSALGRCLGRFFNQKAFDNPYLSFALGLALYCLLRFLPVVGFLAGLLGLFSGLGAIFVYKKSHWLKRN